MRHSSWSSQPSQRQSGTHKITAAPCSPTRIMQSCAQPGSQKRARVLVGTWARAAEAILSGRPFVEHITRGGHVLSGDTPATSVRLPRALARVMRPAPRYDGRL